MTASRWHRSSIPRLARWATKRGGHDPQALQRRAFRCLILDFQIKGITAPQPDQATLPYDPYDS